MSGSITARLVPGGEISSLWQWSQVSGRKGLKKERRRKKNDVRDKENNSAEE